MKNNTDLSIRYIVCFTEIQLYKNYSDIYSDTHIYEEQSQRKVNERAYTPKRMKVYLRTSKGRHFAHMLTATCSTYIEAGASRMQTVQLRRRHSARLPAGGTEVVIGRGACRPRDRSHLYSLYLEPGSLDN